MPTSHTTPIGKGVCENEIYEQFVVSTEELL